jgi:hypothetical protein
MTTQDDLNTPVIAVVGFVSVTVIFVIVILLAVVFHSVNRDLEQERLERGGVLYPQISKLDTDQQGHLAMYDKVDQRFIPISRAMRLVVAELSAAPEAQVTGPASPIVVPPDAPEPNMGGKDDEN